jgi:uncharacterized protein YjbI with pentapeptide repeats
LKKQKPGWSIQSPRLSSQLECPNLSAEDFEKAYLLKEIHLRNLNLDHIQAEAFSWIETVFTQVSFREARLARLEILDCEIQEVDFSNCELERANITRVQFKNSKLLGLNARFASFNDVVFKDCNLNLADFGKARFQKVSFENCLLQDLQLSGASFKQVRFQNCDLKGLDLSDVIHQQLDLRSSRIEGFRAGLKELKGLIMDSEQALSLVHLLGIVVLDEAH